MLLGSAKQRITINLGINYLYHEKGYLSRKNNEQEHIKWRIRQSYHKVKYKTESIIPWNIVQKKILDKKEKLPNWGQVAF